MTKFEIEIAAIFAYLCVAGQEGIFMKTASDSIVVKIGKISNPE
jgi:hypothetical protein